LLDPAAAAPMRAYGLSLTASALAAFLVSVGPDHWTVSFCEQLAINSTAAVMVGALGLVVASASLPARHFWTRCATLAATVAAAAALGLWFEPRCIGGPFAIMDPTVRSLFLMNISEMQSLARMLRLEPLSAVATASFPALSLLATLLVAKALRRDFGFLTTAAAFLLACAATVAVIKFYSYSVWLGVPLVAVAAHYVFGWLKLKSIVPQFVAALLVTPAAVTLGAMTLASAGGTAQGLDIDPPDRQACVRRDSAASLAQLPAGLMVANVLEWGPYLLAFTPHSVLAAPYHIRLGDSILAANDAFGLPPAQARNVMIAAGVDYLVICGPQGPVGLTADQEAASLWGRMKDGEFPDWLVPVPGLDGHPFTVYRLRS
jgi:hypothetical protein